MADETARGSRSLRVGIALIPYAAGIGTAIALWGDKARPLFFSTAAEVLALGAIAMGLQGGFFRVTASPRRDPRGGPVMATILISVGVGLGFAFGALARGDGGGNAHFAVTAGALAMGISAFALQVLLGRPELPADD